MKQAKKQKFADQTDDNEMDENKDIDNNDVKENEKEGGMDMNDDTK